MVQYTDLQKKIAVLIMHEPKTAETLSKQMHISYDQLMLELKELLKLNVVERFGFPTKYKIKDEISSELNRRKEIQETDSNKIRLRAIIEAKGSTEAKLDELLNNILDAMKQDK
ncbi:MAG: hypothetical protein Q7K42_00760, partial [Candidatus Diapherotrites archaeon]|nr:hypothetical protein [Candidatus Diapherotrites archaeon]